MGEEGLMGSKGPCKAKDCGHDVIAKGYCRKHYRLWTHGEMPKPRYKICTAEKCRRHASRGGDPGCTAGSGRERVGARVRCRVAPWRWERMRASAPTAMGLAESRHGTLRVPCRDSAVTAAGGTSGAKRRSSHQPAESRDRRLGLAGLFGLRSRKSEERGLLREVSGLCGTEEVHDG